MSVQEYLQILNNSEIDKVEMTGFIDILPEIGDIPFRGYSDIKITTDSENITIERIYYTEQGDITVSKTTPLKDDISLHCGKNSNPEKLIKDTIEALVSLQKEFGDDVYNRIKILEETLSILETQRTNKSGHTR